MKNECKQFMRECLLEMTFDSSSYNSEHHIYIYAKCLYNLLFNAKYQRENEDKGFFDETGELMQEKYTTSKLKKMQGHLTDEEFFEYFENDSMVRCRFYYIENNQYYFDFKDSILKSSSSYVLK